MNIVLVVFNGATAETYYLNQLSNALPETNNRTIIIPKHAGLKTSGRGISQIKFCFPRSLPKAMLQAFNPLLYRYLLREINSINPDVIHIVFEVRVPFFFASALHGKYPIVTTIHEPRPWQLKTISSIFLNPIQAINNRLLIKSSDKIIVHGEKHKEYLMGKGVSSHKIEVIPHGAFSFFTHWARDDIASQKGNILFFGKILPYKGIEYLIQAAKLVKEHIPEVTITIAGEGNFAPYERQIRGDNSFVVHNRFIPDEEVAEFFQKASIVVLPYVDGSQSGILTTAGAFKKPVVATNVGNFPEIIENGKTGFIIPPRDTNALAEAIIKLLADNKLRQEMGENAYKIVEENLSWDKIAPMTLKVYQEAIENKKTGKVL